MNERQLNSIRRMRKDIDGEPIEKVAEALLANIRSLSETQLRDAVPMIMATIFQVRGDFDAEGRLKPRSKS